MVEKGGGGGDVRQPAVFCPDQAEESTEEEILEEDHRCLEISQRRLRWWETEHWGEIHDERRCWGDLSRDGQRNLRKLLGKG